MITRRRHLAAAALFVLLGSAAAPAVSQAQNVCVDAFVVSTAQKQALARAIVISAPSGGGKTTLMKMLVAEFPELFAFSVSTTTRQPRPGEVNGVDYEFITVAEFKSRIERGEFVEHAEVHGNYYGTSKTKIESILASGRSPLLLVDVQGADVLRNKLNVPYQTIFVQPPNMKVLEERLVGRQTDAPEVIAKRLKNAAGEMARAGEFDVVVINDKLDKAYVDLKAQLLAPAYSHSPVAKFKWPAKGAPADFGAVTGHAMRSMKKDLRFERRDRDRDVIWSGPSNVLKVAMSTPYDQYLKASNLRHQEQNQSRDALTEITGIVLQVGMEQGRRFVMHPSALAKINEKVAEVRGAIASGDLAKADVASKELSASIAKLETSPLTGEIRPFARSGSKIEWDADGYPSETSALAAHLVPVFESAYVIKSNGDTRAILKKHIEDTLRIGMEQGRRVAADSSTSTGLFRLRNSAQLVEMYVGSAARLDDPTLASGVETVLVRLEEQLQRR